MKLKLKSKHRLMCGDSTDTASLARLMDGQLADMWITDPPYNVAVQGGNHGDPQRKNGLRIENDAMGDEQFRQFLRDAYVAADAVMKPGGSFYIWHAESEGFNFRSAAKSCDLRIRQCLIWIKQTLVMGRQDYHWKHEPCLYGWKEGASHNWFTDRKQTTLLEFDRPTRSTDHPTMKPVALFAYLIGNSSSPGQLVLDTFVGSGTALIASEQLSRRCYAMELSPEYCDVVIKRWEALTNKKAVLA